MPETANQKREQAALLRRSAQSGSAHDRAFFHRQAQRLDHQAKELEQLEEGDPVAAD
jgi:hypothetical protein